MGREGKEEVRELASTAGLADAFGFRLRFLAFADQAQE